MRTTIKAYMSNKDAVTTNFNGGPAAVIDYYIGKQFNIGVERDKVVYCHAVEVDGIKYNPSTHRYISERAHEKNLDLIAIREHTREKLEGPRIGDFILIDDKYLRFTHDWGNSIQTTCKRHRDATDHHGFHSNRNGTTSYSGSLDPQILKVDMVLTEEKRDAVFWMFNEDYAMAHNAVYFRLPCRVFKLKAAA